MLSGMLEKLGPVLQRGDSFKGAAEAGGVWDAGKIGPRPGATRMVVRRKR